MNSYVFEYYRGSVTPSGHVGGTRFVHVFGSDDERDLWLRDILADYRGEQCFDPITETEAQNDVAWGSIVQYHGTAERIPETDFMREMALLDDEDDERDLFDDWY